MKRAMQLLLDLVRTLDDVDPCTDSEAWLLRELANVLARARGILEALANSRAEG